MMIFSSSKVFFVLIVSFCVVEGTLTPDGMVSVNCGSEQTFTCLTPDSIGWNIAGLRGINIPGPFLVRDAAMDISRLTSTDTGGTSQTMMSVFTISRFSLSDNGGIIQCVNKNNNITKGMATISVVPLSLPPPTNVAATVQSCSVTLQWDKPSEPNDITTSVSCTPPSPGCAECTTRPCTITGLIASTEYIFTVTLNSGECRASMSTTTARTMDLNAPTNLRAAVESCDNITLQWDQPSEPNDITTSVSCTPPSSGCAECVRNPCIITGLNPSTGYVFTVTFNSGGCRASMSTTRVVTKDLKAPTSLSATVESCDNITLQWTQPSEPNDITTSVSCTPPSPGCTECTTSPCTITGLHPSTEYEFTVTLGSGGCRASINTTGVVTKGLGAPTNVVAEFDSCASVLLQWTQPREPNDITTSVSCTPPSPGCTECTTSPCAITGLNPSTEYEFTVTVSSVCGTSRNTTKALQIDASSCVASNSTSNDNSSDTSRDTPPDASPGDTSLAALAVLAVLIPLLYPLGVLVINVCCFRDKSYCEVFWCCGCFRKDKSARCNSTELMKSPHPREEVEHQDVNKGKHTQFVTDGKEDKNEIGNKQEHVVTYETVEQLGDDDGDIITDETVEQQGNEDGITYATLDFSDNRKGNINVVYSIAEEVTYAAV